MHPHQHEQQYVVNEDGDGEVIGTATHNAHAHGHAHLVGSVGMNSFLSLPSTTVPTPRIDANENGMSVHILAAEVPLGMDNLWGAD